MDARAVFKRKAIELATKLRDRFPSRLMFVLPILERTDEDELFDGYVDNVLVQYGDRIKKRDESFFMTTSDLDDPMQMVQMLRGLWDHMEDPDKEAVWKYMDMFAKLVKLDKSASSSGSDSRR
jgi:hypothetical protein